MGGGGERREEREGGTRRGRRGGRGAGWPIYGTIYEKGRIEAV